MGPFHRTRLPLGHGFALVLVAVVSIRIHSRKFHLQFCFASPSGEGERKVTDRSGVRPLVKPTAPYRDLGVKPTGAARKRLLDRHLDARWVWRPYKITRRIRPHRACPGPEIAGR